MSWWKWLIASLIVVAVGGIAFAGLRERPPPATEVSLTQGEDRADHAHSHRRWQGRSGDDGEDQLEPVG